MIDLHIHTNHSDGQYSPEDIVYMAKEREISILSITDHDTISGLATGNDCAKKAGITFIPGIEISVEGNKELHILGYYVDYTNPFLLDLCDKAMQSREYMKNRILKYLTSQGVEITESQIAQYAGGAISRPHFALALLEMGLISTFQEAFERYLSTPELLTVDRPKPSPREAIEVILKANGVPVLAHPSLLMLDKESLDSFISDLVSCGLKGIECYYSIHTPEQVAYYMKIAEKYNLLITCGSDFHGERISPGKSLGDCGQFINKRKICNIYNGLKNASLK